MIVPKDFEARQKFYENKRNPERTWRQCYNHIVSTLKLLSHSSCTTIVELGCNDGTLAVECLNNLMEEGADKFRWTGYDISPHWLNHSAKHPRYEMHVLEKQIWKTEMPRFDIFVSSHTLEHLFPDEFEALAKWFSTHARFLVFCIPAAWDYSYLKDQHVLGKGIKWIIEILLKSDFRIVWHTGRYFGWYAHVNEPIFR